MVHDCPQSGSASQSKKAELRADFGVAGDAVGVPEVAGAKAVVAGVVVSNVVAPEVVAAASPARAVSRSATPALAS